MRATFSGLDFSYVEVFKINSLRSHRVCFFPPRFIFSPSREQPLPKTKDNCMPPKLTQDELDQLKVSRYSTYVQGHNAFMSNIIADPKLGIYMINTHALTDDLKKKVLDVSQTAVLASWFINLHIHRLCQKGPCDLDVTQSFCKTVCTMISSTRGEIRRDDPDLQITNQLWSHPRTPKA